MIGVYQMPRTFIPHKYYLCFGTSNIWIWYYDWIAISERVLDEIKYKNPDKAFQQGKINHVTPIFSNYDIIFALRFFNCGKIQE